MIEHPSTIALRALYSACVNAHGRNWSSDLDDEDYGPSVMWHAMYDAEVALKQAESPTPVVWMPQPYSDGVVDMDCQGGITYTNNGVEFYEARYVWIGFPEEACVALKKDRLLWLKKAIAWCEQETK